MKHLLYLLLAANLSAATINFNNATGTTTPGTANILVALPDKTFDNSYYTNSSGQIALSTNAFLPYPQFIDLSISAFAFGNGATAPALTALPNTDIAYLAYNVGDIAYGNVQMPHNLATTNDLYTNLVLIPHIHWCPTVNVSGAGSNVNWRLSWRYTPKFSTNVLSGTNTVQVGIVGAATNAGYHILTELCRITNNTASISDDLSIHLSRIAVTGGVTEASTTLPGLQYLDIHVPVGNTTLLGSRQEITQ